MLVYALARVFLSSEVFRMREDEYDVYTSQKFNLFILERIEESIDGVSVIIANYFLMTAHQRCQEILQLTIEIKELLPIL